MIWFDLRDTLSAYSVPRVLTPGVEALASIIRREIYHFSVLEPVLQGMCTVGETYRGVDSTIQAKFSC